jgi:predicted histone-like DNA-binding protein
MIDYSVYMQPNPMDETAAPKAYAKAQMRENMSFSDFVSHIAGHNGVFSRGTVKGVLSDAVYCLVEQLLEGKKVQLGELGNFWVSLTSIGADSMENFSASNIKEVNIVFTPGEDFENLRGRATFNLVASRVAQAATLKTEKQGGTVVDLEAARAAARPSGSGSNGSSQSSGGSNGSSGSSGTNPTNTGGDGGGGGDAPLDEG